MYIQTGYSKEYIFIKVTETYDRGTSAWQIRQSVELVLSVLPSHCVIHIVTNVMRNDIRIADVESLLPSSYAL
jgi:hypothetical protein